MPYIADFQWEKNSQDARVSREACDIMHLKSNQYISAHIYTAIVLSKHLKSLAPPLRRRVVASFSENDLRHKAIGTRFQKLYTRAGTWTRVLVQHRRQFFIRSKSPDSISSLTNFSNLTSLSNSLVSVRIAKYFK